MTLTTINAQNVVRGGEYGIRIAVDLPEKMRAAPDDPFELTAWAEVRPRTGLTVQWEKSTDDGVTWIPIPDATDPVYSLVAAGVIGPPSSFRAVFTAADNSTATTSACAWENPFIVPPPEE